MREAYRFEKNNLLITGVDIKSVGPTDEKTINLLRKSVQMAIEITTNSQEAAARHEANKLEQEARGKLEHQKIIDEAEVEKSKQKLLQMQIAAAALESTGEAKAVALGKAETDRIQSQSMVAKSKAEVDERRIVMESEIEQRKKKHELEMAHLAAKSALELKQKRALAQLEANRFSRMVQSIGRENLSLMARAGSKHDIQMLQALGIRSTLITDGSTPINLLTTADGLIGRTNASEAIASTMLEGNA